MSGGASDYQAPKIRLIMELRRQRIRDDRVLSAIERTPRELFLAAPFLSQAYDNVALPIAQGQTISQPYVVAFMTEALALEPGMRVLEIGTGSGYQAAVLAQMGVEVFTVERRGSLLGEARSLFAKLGLDKINCKLADGIEGWPELAPFERIIVTAAPEAVPAALLEQLGENGIMVIPVGRPQHQTLIKISNRDGSFVRENLLPVRFVPLVAGISETLD